MIHDETAIDEIISGTTMPALYIFAKYNIHEERTIMNTAAAKEDFLSKAYTVEVIPIDIKNNTDKL